jgi:hypothetical protein
MPPRRIVPFILAAILFGIAALFVLKGRRGASSAPASKLSSSTEVATAPATTASGSKTRPDESTAEPNLLAAQLNAPKSDIRRDLETLNSLFVNFQTNFPQTGNPVGENSEITAALTGANPLDFAFLPKNHPAINAAGQLCDRWGTPFRFHQLGGFKMEIRSAGPDRKFGTADDAEFAPWPK